MIRLTINQKTYEAQEGATVIREHKSRERDPKIVKLKKEKELLRKGTLKCEACGFDFKAVYGDRGENYIECHHRKPVSELKAGEKTALDDLALVCANCHRMIHRTLPMLSISDLRLLISKNS